MYRPKEEAELVSVSVKQEKENKARKEKKVKNEKKTKSKENCYFVCLVVIKIRRLIYVFRE